MSDPVLKITKIRHDQYKVDFSTDDGRIVCEVALRKAGEPPDTRPDAQKQESATLQARAVAQALVDALTDDEG